MFQTEIREPSLGAFVGQQMGLLVGSLLWCLLTVSLPIWFSDVTRPVGRILESLSIIFLAGVPFFFLGRFVQYRFPGLALSGRWVWVLPALGFMAVLISSLTAGHSAFSDLFSPPGEGEAWWGVLIFTYPTLGSIGYSLGLRLNAHDSQ